MNLIVFLKEGGTKAFPTNMPYLFKLKAMFSFAPSGTSPSKTNKNAFQQSSSIALARVTNFHFTVDGCLILEGLLLLHVLKAIDRLVVTAGECRKVTEPL